MRVCIRFLQGYCFEWADFQHVWTLMCKGLLHVEYSTKFSQGNYSCWVIAHISDISEGCVAACKSAATYASESLPTHGMPAQKWRLCWTYRDNQYAALCRQSTRPCMPTCLHVPWPAYTFCCQVPYSTNLHNVKRNTGQALMVNLVTATKSLQEGAKSEQQTCQPQSSPESVMTMRCQTDYLMASSRQHSQTATQVSCQN